MFEEKNIKTNTGINNNYTINELKMLNFKTLS